MARVPTHDPPPVPDPPAGREGLPDLARSPLVRAELLDPAGWHEVLAGYAASMKLAVALADPAGRLLGPCHNPQPLWSAARAAMPAPDGACPFCLTPLTPCTAAADALRAGTPVLTRDQSGLVHVAVPLRLGEARLGVLLAGQVFAQFPESLWLDRLARAWGLSAPILWRIARRQRPVSPATLQVYSELLATLGKAVLQARYGTILERHRAAEILTLHQDVAAHTRAEAQERDLRAEAEGARRHLETVLASLNDAFLVLDRDWRVVHANDKAAERVGVPKAQLLGVPIWHLVPDVAGSRFDDEVRRAMAAQTPVQFEWYAPTRGRWFECRVSPWPMGLTLLEADITARKQAEAHLKAMLQEKEVLLKEIHHRVKNNLQIIASLLALQADGLHDPTLVARLEDSQHRVHSMALIHETLYQAPDLARFHFAQYVEQLATYLFLAYTVPDAPITLHTQADDVALDLDRAIPCGLILNELLSNALKYAFPDGRAGEIRVELQAVAGQVRLRVRDTGVGLPQGLEWRQPDSLGLQLVGLLTEQLGGTLTLERDGGTAVTILFPP
jgi:PAS domain S-box-containing protein